jgi:AcrR family transcriptional regulator
MRAVPRVSDEHLAARRQQILDAARICFLRGGFHQTSMQDVIREAGLSVGAVYRYFPSKNDLIKTLTGQVIGEVGAMFDQMGRQTPPLDVATSMRRAIAFATANTGPDGLLRLAIQVWSESLIDPALAEVVREVYQNLRGLLIAMVERIRAAGGLPADADPVAVGSVLFALLPGYALQRVLTGEPDEDVFNNGLRTLLSPSARPA